MYTTIGHLSGRARARIKFKIVPWCLRVYHKLSQTVYHKQQSQVVYDSAYITAATLFYRRYRCCTAHEYAVAATQLVRPAQQRAWVGAKTLFFMQYLLEALYLALRWPVVGGFMGCTKRGKRTA